MSEALHPECDGVAPQRDRPPVTLVSFLDERYFERSRRQHEHDRRERRPVVCPRRSATLATYSVFGKPNDHRRPSHGLIHERCRPHSPPPSPRCRARTAPANPDLVGNLQSSVLTSPNRHGLLSVASMEPVPRPPPGPLQHLGLVDAPLPQTSYPSVHGHDQASVVGLLHHPNADASGALVSAS